TISVPLYQLVYHDAVLITYGEGMRGGHNNLLLGCLCAGVPDLPIDLSRLNANSLSLMREMAALNKRVGLLEMRDHEFLDPDRHRERSTFGEGTTVPVDWRAQTVDIAPPLTKAELLGTGINLVTPPHEAARITAP